MIIRNFLEVPSNSIKLRSFFGSLASARPLQVWTKVSISDNNNSLA